MVSFTSIAQGVTLVAIMVIGSSNAAPFEGATSRAVPHIDDNNVVQYKLPPIINSRTVVKTPHFRGDLNAEAESAKLNREWFNKHGGNTTLIDKRADPETIAGLTMVVPSNAPAVPNVSGSGIVQASSAQITEYRQYAALSATAYCSSVITSGQWTCNDCKKYVPDGKLIVTFNSAVREVGGYVLRSDTKRTIYLSFRGSNNWKNWLVNLDFNKINYTPVSGATVHGGFYKAYQELSSYFYAKLLAEHKAYPSYQVVVTGHSLGGAQALLATLDLFQRVSTLNVNNLSVYTNGSPRVGNDQFAYYVDYTGLKNYRTVYNRDIVPHLPPQNFGFLHPGIEIWATSGTAAKICNPNIETNKCSNSIVPFTNFNDHLTYFNVGQGCN